MNKPKKNWSRLIQRNPFVTANVSQAAELRHASEQAPG
jgi:hypothetical protein